MGSNSDLLSGLIGSLIGGTLSLVGALWGANEQHRKQQIATEGAEAARIRGFLGAVEAELTVIWERYELRVRPTLHAVPAGGIFNFEWPTNQDYFTVYTANAGLLGRVPDPELRRLIVRAYTFAKGILDSIAMNARILREQMQLQGNANALTAHDVAMLQHFASVLPLYADAIKTSDAELAAVYAKLIPMLRAATSSQQRPVSWVCQGTRTLAGMVCKVTAWQLR
jgi:hypothetical protein